MDAARSLGFAPFSIVERKTLGSPTGRVARDTGGFTLIELLIVVVILGILAAIAMPRFTSTRSKAFDGAAQSDLRNAMTAQEAYYADNLAYAADVADLGFDPSEGVTVSVTSADRTGFVMTAEHAQGSCWSIDSEDGQIAREGDDC